MTAIIPSAEQQAILDLGLDSVRIKAGAGTGKTTTVALVIANLVAAHGIDPERILGITFTNKAASELSDRVKTFLGPTVDEGRQAEVHTYHGFAAQILAEFGALVGVDSRVRVITPTFSRQLLTETYHHTSYSHLDITNRRGVDRIRVLADRMGDHLLVADDLLPFTDPSQEVWAQRGEMLETLRQYEGDKRRLGVVDYSDLVTLSTALLTRHPELAGEIRDRYQTVVLDEYQDTNPAQRALLTAIFGNGFPVVAVGDEDQTIYEWRGASAENFELFFDHFPAPGGRRAHERALTLNRRSAPVILDVANQIRRRANPESENLVSSDPDARGQVITHWATDAVAEADWIARRFEALHGEGTPWSEMAVLFRKNRDFAVVVDSMARHDIPVEVANLGGLLSVPEVADLRAWLTVIDRPEHSAALVQILFGSRYRLGYADIAPLSRWLGTTPVEDIDSDHIPGLSLLEAIEHHAAIEGLRPKARAGLEHFLATYREVLTESQGASLVEVCRLILDRTHAWQDLEALPPSQRTTARLNLYRLLDLAEEWSPLRGRPSLAAFLDYLDAMEDEPAEELDSAHLSGEEAVTLVTVHRAKGLEWDVVAVPAVTDGSFPTKSQQFPDPARFAEYLPPQYRIDRALSDMPSDDEERRAYFRRLHALQEWRVAYVAATRARSTLIVTGAYWYGLPEPSVNARKPSELFELVEQHPLTRNEGHAEEPPRPALLRPPADGPAPDPLFTNGWDGALREAVMDATAPHSEAERLGLVTEYGRRVEEMRQTLFELDSVGTIAEEPGRQRVVSVTGLVNYAQCPKRFYWSDVDPLPRRRSNAAIAGTGLHRRIELHQRGQVPFEDMEPGLYDVIDDDGEPFGAGGFKAFLESRYGSEQAPLVEVPFTIEMESGFQVRGRIDAVYARGRSWEIVDFKSGKRRDDPARMVQLQAYSVAATKVDFGLEEPEQIDVSFVYLGGGLDVHTERADEQWQEQARVNLERLTDAIDAARFEPVPGAWCNGCDFLRFCTEGKREVGRP
ncbi:MAG TPA: ATP-dependent DNA helicase [Acidimicrobiia bacterium]|nr:ATP-dependent DNA helicase [Acidimicrobiia bacterium]